jgi:non-ribosomal peptide synthetase component F
MQHVRQVHLDAQSHQEVPFEQLVESLQVVRTVSHTPLFQILFSTNTDYGLEKTPDIAGEVLAGVKLQYSKAEYEIARFVLKITINMDIGGRVKQEP